MSEKILTNKELKKIYCRGLTFQAILNYGRMQAVGFTNMMAPALEKIYKDRPKEEKVAAMQRHLKFYNNHNTMNYFVVGLTCALEENTTEEEKDSVINVKTGLMGPLAGVGDAFFWSTVYPILASIGSNIALAGSVFGPIFLFLTWNIFNQGSKWLLLKTGYEKGVEVVTGGQGKAIIDYITKFASIVGMFVVGNLICSTVNINVLTSFTTGELVLNLQSILDSIMPNLLPAGVVGLCYYLIKKTDGKCINKLLYGLFLAGLVLAGFGILG